jgi:hypothetical protein
MAPLILSHLNEILEFFRDTLKGLSLTTVPRLCQRRYCSIVYLAPQVQVVTM